MEFEETSSQDICRVCRCEATSDRPLFHPCICTGSIKYIHQECLLQWLRYSKKEFCELCNHRFSFTPIYAPDMPKRLPLSIVVSGFLGTVARAVRFWLHYTMVAVAWLGVVPLTACRIYRTLFTGSVSSVLTLPFNVFSTENIMSDILHGCAVVTLTLLGFIGLVWLREQIVHGGGPEWLDMDGDGAIQPVAAPAEVLEEAVARPENQPAEAVVDAAAAVEEAGEQLPPAEPLDNNILGDAAQEDNILAEPPAPEILDANNADVHPENDLNAAIGGDEGQWNPMDWDRGPEDLTWERLLGLDGSLVFLEHVFWVVSLNTLFILVFAFCPYHIGHFTIVGFKFNSYIMASHFEGMLTTLCGYCVIGVSLVFLHAVASLLKSKASSRFFGLGYVVVKVALLLVIEIVAFPVVCGWWLDICSLALFDATLKDRQLGYHQSPTASIFIHWLIGMVYVFYFASFVILLREVLRPGVLWFLRNFNDPDFNPVQEMIHMSVFRHIRRLGVSLVMFGTSILVMLYLPSRIIRKFLPSFLPYQTAQATDSQVDELAMELLLLLVILPAVQDQNHTREWLKHLLRGWCVVVAWVLDLRSYLFGDVPLVGQALADQEATQESAEDDGGDGGERQGAADEEEEELILMDIDAAVADGEEAGGGLGAVHHALLIGERQMGFQPYNKPKLFALRIAALLIFMLISWLLSSLLLMLLPVWIGRRAFALWLSSNERVFELYTSAMGIYTCLLLVRGGSLLAGWIHQGWAQVSAKVREWSIILAKASVAVILLIGIVPLLFGLLLELVILMPMRVPLTQTPVFFLWQDWALGAMYTKITIALAFMGPEWWLKRSIEQLYQDGLRELNLGFILPGLVLPALTALGLALALPYIVSRSLIPLFVSDEVLLITVERRIYPFLLLVIVVLALIVIQLKQFRKLCEHIKNDRYLVGRRLVNYNHSRSNSVLAAAPNA